MPLCNVRRGRFPKLLMAQSRLSTFDAPFFSLAMSTEGANR